MLYTHMSNYNVMTDLPADHPEDDRAHLRDKLFDLLASGASPICLHVRASLLLLLSSKMFTWACIILVALKQTHMHAITLL